MSYWGTGRLGTHQSVAYTATAGTIATAITAGIQKLRVVTTTAAYIKIGKAADVVTTPAAATDVYLPADHVEYLTVKEGEKVSAIRVSSDGTLHVTEVP